MLKKESGFSVTEDYTKRIREERQELYNFKCAEQKDGQKAVIRYNKLYLDEDVFMFDWEIEKVKWVGKRPPLGKQKDSGPNSAVKRALQVVKKKTKVIRNTVLLMVIRKRTNRG